jgi:rhamnogalacturonan acetylesterase
MVDGALSKGATPILSSQTPNNPYEGVDTINFTPSRVRFLPASTSRTLIN